MISFESDYNNGAHPKVLEALIKTNDEQTLSYGFDRFSIDAKEKIKNFARLPTRRYGFLPAEHRPTPPSSTPSYTPTRVWYASPPDI